MAPQLAPSVQDLTPDSVHPNAKNIYQNMHDTKMLVFTFFALWALLVGAVQIPYAAIPLIAILLMFPATIFGLALLPMLVRYVQGKMLARVLTPGSTTWRALAIAYTVQGTVLVPIFFTLIFPLIFPFLLISDALRVLEFIVKNLMGQRVRFGGDEFLFYQKQARRYNQILASHGLEAAEDFLRITSVLTDAPIAAEIRPDDWNNGIRDEIVAHKENKYGPMSAFGV